MKFLLAEDEQALRTIVAKRLKEAGYGVDAVSDGEEAIAYIDVYEYDLIILDVMMPKADGLTVLRYIRKLGLSTPVLLLTAKDQISDRVNGLDAGADDYLTKPFAFEELFARVRALLRRQENLVGNVLTVADLSLNTVTKEVKRGDTVIELTAKEYAILDYLLRNKGSILTRIQIEEHVWSSDYDNESNVMAVYIRYLRRKIDDPFDTKLIHTVRGIGYSIKEVDA